MIISSRTPEGQPNRCPLCGASISLEPSMPMGDAPCPRCGHLLWFFNAGGHTTYIDRERADPMLERLIARWAELLGVPQQTIREKVERGDYSLFLPDTGADSLDLVELVMELEEEFNDFAHQSDAR